MPRLVRVASLVAVALAAASATLSGQTASNLDTLIARCVAAGRPAIQQAFPTEQAFRTIRGDLFQKTRDWRQQWTPTGPTFLLELAAWGLEQSWVDSVVVLRIAGDLVIRRSAAMGTDPAQDKYEIAFHRTAVALLTSSRLFDEADRYLDMVRLRISPAPVAGEARLVDQRLLLTRALVLDARTAPGFWGTISAGGMQANGRPGGSLKEALERADAAYEPAAQVPELAAEVQVRRAFLRHRLGRHADALALLTKAADAGTDVTVQYWRHLFTGRILEALNRPAEAAPAYERANALVPGAQTPAVALASLYQRQGELGQARKWAAAARTASRTEDPWWQYWVGDLRLYPQWLDVLRAARP